MVGRYTYLMMIKWEFCDKCFLVGIWICFDFKSLHLYTKPFKIYTKNYFSIELQKILQYNISVNVYKYGSVNNYSLLFRKYYEKISYILTLDFSNAILPFLKLTNTKCETKYLSYIFHICFLLCFPDL